eukprot:gnl/MRDRNA2_/MRDRNA2_75859_c0_seq1.p1 gnl/MRDRNA2_/MRDRNA2_75859_c0~~gnl/MRDRNA2_/MRDRNA2_75859_c0_seq1.p1  ORF type:complete len:114 (+),score=8.95 gnl/MRDRNA2_/MRDRNA2_75859_c0_seq1:198-539(+)
MQNSLWVTKSMGVDATFAIMAIAMVMLLLHCPPGLDCPGHNFRNLFFKRTKIVLHDKLKTGHVTLCTLALVRLKRYSRQRITLYLTQVLQASATVVTAQFFLTYNDPCCTVDT